MGLADDEKQLDFKFTLHSGIINCVAKKNIDIVVGSDSAVFWYDVDDSKSETSIFCRSQ